MGIIEKQSVQDIANAIRDRNGLTTLYKPREMDEAILNLYSTTKVNSMLDYILPCHEEEATDFTIKYADSDRPCSISELEGNTTQNGTPTPTSPVEIKTVSGDNNIVVSNEQHVTGNSYRVDFGGKNLLNNTATTQTINGITFTVNSDKSVTINGTATAHSVLYLGSQTIPVGTYTLSGCPKNGAWSTYSLGYGNYNDSGNGSTFTLTSSLTTNPYIRIGNGTTVSNLTFYPQLEKRKFSNRVQSLCI